jgi:hypothetical protein
MKKFTSFLFALLFITFSSKSQTLVGYSDFESTSSYLSYSSGAYLANSCGSAYGNYACYFNSNTTMARYVETIDYNMSGGGYLSFYIYIPSTTFYSYCEASDLYDDVYLDYSVDGGYTWYSMKTYYAGYGLYDYFVSVSASVPASAQTSSTRFRFSQPYFSGLDYDNWAIDELAVYSYGCSAATPYVYSSTGSSTICNGGSITLTASSGYYSYYWSTGATTQSISVSAPGSYYVSAMDYNGCTATSTYYTVENPYVGLNVTASSTAFCPGDPVQLSFSTSYQSYYSYYFNWSPSSSLSSSTAEDPIAYPQTATTYNVSVSEYYTGCTTSKSVTLTPSSAGTLSALFNYSTVNSTVYFSNSSYNATSYYWSFGDGSTSSLSNPSHTYSTAGTYTVSLYAYDDCGNTELYYTTVTITDCPLTFTVGPDGLNYIDGISLNTINTDGFGYVSGSVYTDNTSMYTSLMAGTTYTLTVFGSGSNNETFGAWIDYNHNYSLSDPGELLGVAKSTGGKGTITFTVPTTVTGSTVLRVLSQEDYSSSSLDPCGTYSYGEVEDYTVVFTTAGIEETAAENNITVFPNPTTGVFTLNLENTNGNYIFQITDIKGQVLQAENVEVIGNTFNTQFDLSSYAKGMYFLRVIGENNESINQMIIKE